MVYIPPSDPSISNTGPLRAPEPQSTPEQGNRNVEENGSPDNNPIPAESNQTISRPSANINPAEITLMPGENGEGLPGEFPDLPTETMLHPEGGEGLPGNFPELPTETMLHPEGGEDLPIIPPDIATLSPGENGEGYPPINELPIEEIPIEDLPPGLKDIINGPADIKEIPPIQVTLMPGENGEEYPSIDELPELPGLPEMPTQTLLHPEGGEEVPPIQPQTLLHPEAGEDLPPVQTQTLAYPEGGEALPEDDQLI